MKLRILKLDPQLSPYEKDLNLRMEQYIQKKQQLLAPGQTLLDFANGYLYFGFHRTDRGWYYREWAPGADAMYLTGDFCGWDRHAHPMEKKENGVFELFLPGQDALPDGSRVMAVVVHGGRELDRIPAYATRVVQEPNSPQWNGVIHVPREFPWTDRCESG